MLIKMNIQSQIHTYKQTSQLNITLFRHSLSIVFFLVKFTSSFGLSFHFHCQIVQGLK